MLQPMAAQRGIALHLHAGGVEHVHTDRQRLHQVLTNLISNAIKYNRPAGRVDVNVGRGEDGSVDISVTDTGVGIAAPDLAQVFEPFYRVARDAPLKDSCGLGLSVARALAHAMGGDIAASSALGEGSTFVLRLRGAEVPAAFEAPPAPASRRSEEARDGGGLLLYIEDNEVNRLIVEAYLQDQPDIQLACGEDGRSGIQLARALRPSLILIDMDLPDMTGTEVLQQVLADPLLNRTPCAAFSANALDSEVEAAIAAGFREYLVKPIGKNAFLAAVDRLMSRKAGSRQ
jgi:CheY-like chemotaxis protein